MILQLICANCGKSFEREKRGCKPAPRYFCDHGCHYKYKISKGPERFWKRVLKTESIEDCWLWHKPPGPSQTYPMVNCKYVSDLPSTVHVVAFVLYHGHKPNGWVCHTCNNPRCCNPHHLYDGTAKTNHEDAIRAGTFKPLKTKYGEQVPSHKLTQEIVNLIRRVYPRIPRGKKTEFAKLFPVHPASVRRVAHNHYWVHGAIT